MNTWSIVIVSVSFALIFAAGLFSCLYFILWEDKISLGSWLRSLYDEDLNLDVEELKAQADQYQLEVERQRVDRINAQGLGWKAKLNPFAAYPNPYWFSSAITMPAPVVAESIKLWANADFVDESMKHADLLLQSQKAATIIPSHFDARLAWPLCPTVHRIFNQGRCGSCWAVAFTSAISDRICIHSNGTKKVQLSTQDLIECCANCNGCGGTPSLIEPALYWLKHGLVTGGAYHSNEGCLPYDFMPKCGSPCPTLYYEASNKLRPSSCRKSCRIGYGRTYAADKYYGAKVYFLGSARMIDEFLNLQKTSNEGRRLGRRDYYGSLVEGVGPTVLMRNLSSFKERDIAEVERIIQMEMMTNGPLAICFKVFREFLHYSHGVYHLTNQQGPILYGHCVKILGWGEEFLNPTAINKDNTTIYYWIAANSWGRDWGEAGFFRIIRGNKSSTDELTLYEDIVAGIPA